MRKNPMIGAIVSPYNMAPAYGPSAGLPVVSTPSKGGMIPQVTKPTFKFTEAPKVSNNGGVQISLPNPNNLDAPLPTPKPGYDTYGSDPNAFYSTAPTEPAKSGISTPLLLGGAALLAYFLFKN